MDVILAKENADGSAVFTFDMTAEEIRMMVLLGIKTALLAGIEDAKLWNADSDLAELQNKNRNGSDVPYDIATEEVYA
jgi:hypothetical protein